MLGRKLWNSLELSEPELARVKHTARLSDPTGFFLARTEIPGREPQICPPAYAPAKGQGLLWFPLRTACAPALQPTGNQPGTFSHG